MHLDINNGKFTYEGPREEIVHQLLERLDPATVDVRQLAAAIHGGAVEDIAVNGRAENDVPWDKNFVPEVPDHATIENAIRDCLKEFRTGQVKLANMVVDLTDCAYAGGTPLMDKPINGHLGTITVTRPDGLQKTLQMDGTTWDDLWNMIDSMYEHWQSECTMFAAEFARTLAIAERTKTSLDAVEQERNTLVRELTARGITKYRLSLIGGVSQPTVARWEKQR